MKYALNDYYMYANNTDTRVEVYSDDNTAANLLSHHKQNGAVELAVYECVGADKSNLPMPGDLMQALDLKITAAAKRVVITGIDAYLSLLDMRNVKAFMTALHGRIDRCKLNAAYLISRNRFDGSNFTNPKYENSLQVVHIGEDVQYLTQPSVTVVPKKWAREDNNTTNWNVLLKKFGQFEPTGEYTLVLDNYEINHAGLSDNVLQQLGITERYAPVSLPNNVREILAQQCKDSNVSPLDFLKSRFGQENVNIRFAVKRLLELRNDELWPAYVWFLKKTIDGVSYLTKVLSADINVDNLLRTYVCDTAITVLTYTNAQKFANERASAIKELENVADYLIIEFIANIKQQGNETAACWLNCNTDAERIEIVRRVSESDLTLGLPRIWQNIYPLLADYLSDEYTYGNNDLTDYFRDYRRLKITNDITADFVKRAFNFVLPSTFTSRDAVLQELSVDKSTALLVVDGMGAEYFPLILSISKRKALNVEYVAIAAVKLPASTKFNHIIWEENRRLIPNIHKIDNISHDGAVKHENCPPSHNIAATLAVFDEITNRVANGLTKFERVVVTADHGSSRLAVLAHEKNLNTTLPWNGEPQDWRFSTALPNTERPSELESFYVAEENATYWVVRGYNRLPKKGGKLSVHGGATLEERLVPIVVFSKAKSDNASKQPGKQAGEQLVEKMGYDI